MITHQEMMSLDELDFDPELTCESQTKNCQNPISWSWTLLCCHEQLLLCDPCTDETQEWIKHRLTTSLGFLHLPCQTEMSWDLIIIKKVQ